MYRRGFRQRGLPAGIPFVVRKETKMDENWKNEPGRIHSIESFGSVDGPGVRYVIFVQGCRMRCRYCHNPETWALEGGECHTAEEMLQKALRYRSYWGKTGGITVSGGEPLLQLGFLTSLFEKAKAAGISTVIDTAGNPFTREEPFFSRFQELLAYTDLFLLDIKQMDPAEHKALTGCDNHNILDLAQYLSDQGKDMWIRHVLVPGLTDGEAELCQMAAFVKGLKTVKRLEVLPYHALGLFKWDKLGIPYTLRDAVAPTAEEVKRAEQILGTEDYKGYLQE